MNPQLREQLSDWTAQVVSILNKVAVGAPVSKEECDRLAKLQASLANELNSHENN
jgi:hypothetical protein